MKKNGLEKILDSKSIWWTGASGPKTKNKGKNRMKNWEWSRDNEERRTDNEEQSLF